MKEAHYEKKLASFNGLVKLLWSLQKRWPVLMAWSRVTGLDKLNIKNLCFVYLSEFSKTMCITLLISLDSGGL
jgi:hypothetical protein